MIDFKIIGGMLLVVGTSIGAGMLALPVATATLGFPGACAFLFLVWALMTYSALLILEVNLWLPRKTNLISMSQATLGFPGQAIAWVTYLMLLYSLLAAYISGGSDILHHLSWAANLNTSEKVDAFLFTGVIAFIVYRGISAVDHTNRYLMITKLVSLFALVICVVPFVEAQKLMRSHVTFSMAAIIIMVTSFGFGTIVPSLRVYYEDDVKALRKVILIGSFIPLVCYILWVWAIHGVLPEIGENGLLDILHRGHTTSALVQSLSNELSNAWITTFADIFTSFSVATSFLGVSLGLSDFLSDGFKMPKVGKKKLIIFALTFLPPLLIVWVNPNIFLKGLDYAGTCCAILLMLLPALMAWRGRYHKKIAKGYRVAGGRVVLLLIIMAAVLLILFGFRPELLG